MTGLVIIGRAIHYVIGVIFTVALLITEDISWDKKSNLAPTSIVGVVTAVTTLLWCCGR